MKYIIEIEDVPFSKVRIDADNGAQNINLYRAKGFNSLVFDKHGLDKLTPLDKSLEENYQRGLQDSRKCLSDDECLEHLERSGWWEEHGKSLKAMTDKAYQKGLDEAWANVGECEDRVAKQAYQKGLDDAWEAAKKIVISVDKGGLSGNDLLEIFGCESTNYAFRKYSASEVIEKLKAYEESQKADAEIKVGDEVTPKSNNSNWLGVVVGVDDTDAMVMTRDGYTAMYRLEILKKTDKHFPQMAELLRAMKEGAE